MALPSTGTLTIGPRVWTNTSPYSLKMFEDGTAQKIVYVPNGGGIFIIIRVNPQTGTSDSPWAVIRSTDLGKTWKTIYNSGTRIGAVCAIEADAAGNIYTLNSSRVPNGRNLLWTKITKASGYTAVSTAQITAVNDIGGDKMTTLYDWNLDKIIYFSDHTRNNPVSNIFRLNADGSVDIQTAMYVAATVGGHVIVGERTQFAMTPTGYAVAWTTLDQTLGDNYYSDQLLTCSTDLATFHGASGLPLTLANGGLPVTAAPGGGSWFVTRSVDFTPVGGAGYVGNDNQLRSACYNSGFINLMYHGWRDPGVHRVLVRFNVSTKVISYQLDTWGPPGAPATSPAANFAQDRTLTGRLYLSTINSTGDGVDVHVSDDGGQTWKAYANGSAALLSVLHYPGMAREVDQENGLLHGVFVEATGGGGSGTAYGRYWNCTIGTGTVQPVAPANTVAPAITGTPVQGQTLTCGTGTWSGTTPMTFTYAWSNGKTTATITLVAADVGTTLTCTVTATNSAGSASKISNAVGPVTAPQLPPTNTSPPTISGTTTQGQTLTADPGTWTGTTPITFAYQWNDSATGAITGATSQTYVLQAGDVGNNITVTVTASNPVGHSAVTSAAVGPVLASNPATAPSNTTLPAISGTTTQGQTLTASPGTWSGTTPITYTYQWSDSLTGPTGGATGLTYVLQSADVGQTVTVTVTATNSVGTGTPATSAAVGPVQSSAPPPSGAAFPNTPVRDTFNYVANPLSAPAWTTNAFTVGSLQANGVVAFSAAPDGTSAGGLWTGLTASSVFTTPPIQAFVTVSQVMAIAARRVSLLWGNEGALDTDTTFYGYRVSFDNSNGGTLYIDSIAAGVVTTLWTQTGIGLLVNGNSIGVNIDDGGIITAWREQAGAWSSVTTFQDPTLLWQQSFTPPLGYIGMSTNDVGVQFENFGGGSLAFPTTPVRDTFSYTANPLGHGWTAGIGAFVGFQANGNIALTTGAQSAGLWTNNIWQNVPLEAYVDVAAVPATATDWVALYWANTQAVTATHYHYRIAWSNASGGTVSVNRQLAGANEVVTFSAANVGTFAVGDGIGVKFDPSGLVYMFLRHNGNWNLVASWLDASPLWTQNLSVPLQYLGFGTNDAAAEFDNFGGGPTVSGSSLLSTADWVLPHFDSTIAL